MVMDDDNVGKRCKLPLLVRFFLLVLIACVGCTPYVGTTAKSFLGHVRTNPDPNARYVAYAKLGSDEAYDTEAQKREAVATLIDKFERGREPVASRAIICRSLGELRDQKARDLMVKAVSSPEAVIKIEACRALGKVGRPEDATILAQIMTLDNLEDARIAAIEGLAELRTKDPRILQVLLEGMDHEDPAIRLASLTALRKLLRKDYGTDPAAWRKQLEPALRDAVVKPVVDAVTTQGPAPGEPGPAANRLEPAPKAIAQPAGLTPPR
jgi:hypothetical protein